MATVRINTYDQTTGPQGAALPQANIPGNFQIEANAARQFGALGNALRGLAEVELRMREAQRVDTLNAARVNYINDIAREQERLGNEDTDYETQRARYVQFQKERRDFYGAQLDQDLRQDFDTAILLPSTQHEFQVGQMAMAGLNDKILANVNQRITDLTSQSGFDRGKDAESLSLIEQELATLVNNKVIGQDKAREVLAGAKQNIQLNQLGVMAETDPEAIIGATQGFRVPVENLSKEGVIGKATGNKGAIKNSIYDKAVAAGQDPRMMLGIANAESGFDPSAKSVVDPQGRYAAGLFQFRGPAARQVGIMDDNSDRRFDAEANMDGAMKYMDYIASQVPGGRSRPDLMIAAWYQGPHNADIQAGKVPAAAVAYVDKVLKYGYGEDGLNGLPELRNNPEAAQAQGVGQYNKLLSMGYTTQQALHFVDLAESNIAAQQRQAEQQAATAYTEFVNSSYAQMWNEAGERLPDMESRHNYMSAKINSIADRELRGRYQALLKSDIDADVTRQNAVDQQIIHNVMQEVKGQGLSHNRAWETIQSNPALVAGISDAGMKSLEKEIVGERKVTLKNQSAANSLKYWIDKGRGQLTREQIQSAIFESDLTMDQGNDVLRYFDGSGKMSSATYSAVNSELKRQTDDKQDLGKMPFLYEEVLNSLPDGEPANPESISRAINKLLMEGEQVRSGLWNKSMTYAEALESGVGASWLPDLSKEEKMIAQAELQAKGVANITEHRLQVYWRETKLGLPEYETAKQQDMLRQFPGLGRAMMWGR